jgi:putative glutamine amidotransferase
MEKPIVGIGADVGASKPRGRERAFTYLNYIESLRRAGAIPLLIPPQPENAAELLEQLDGIVLAGGDDCDPALYGEEKHPSNETMDQRRQDNELALARLAREKGIPMLGICLGAQVMSVAAGGNLYQDIQSQLEGAMNHASEPEARSRHDVTVDRRTRLGEILGVTELNVNSSHHQAVRNAGRGMRVAAKASDGIVEAVEDPEHRFYVGVQWHPEDMGGEDSAGALFAAFVEAARAYAREKREVATTATPL